MKKLTATQLVMLGKWGLGILYYDKVKRAAFVNYARTSYLNLKAVHSAPPPTQDDVLPLLRTDVMTDQTFINTVTAKNPYIPYKNLSPQSAYYNLAELFSIYILTKEWSTISI